MASLERLTKIVSACVLGDAHITKPKSESANSKLELFQTIPHLDHIEFLESELGTLTRVHRNIRSYENPNHKDQIRLMTRHHPFYTNVRNRFYINGKKVVDPHALTLLDAEFLAVWYMHDGTYGDYGRSGRLLRLCTEAFSYGDNELLRKALYEKLNLNFSIHKKKHNYVLDLKTKDHDKFADMVRPFIQDSFLYKLPDLPLERVAPYIK